MFFPHIYRILTANIRKLVYFPFLVLFGVLIYINISLHSPDTAKPEKPLVIDETNNVLGVELKKGEIMIEIDYWKKIVNKYPDYNYGYLILAKLYNQTGDRTSYTSYLNKYREITFSEVPN